MPALTKAFEAHPVYTHTHTHSTGRFTDLGSFRELPDSYAWTAHDDDNSDVDPDSFPYLSAGRGESYSLPVVDLGDPNALDDVGHACRTWGAFQVINHGVAARLLDDIEESGRRLFDLPTEQKVKAARPPNGISGYGLAPISSFFPKLMWSEGFTVVGSPADHARQLWPQDYTNFCDVTEEYEKEMKQLAGRLMWLMLGSLGLTKEEVKWAGPQGDFKGAYAAIQMNSYPACPDPDRAMGLAAHTDSTLLTILHQNRINGLQVLRQGVGWVTVPSLPGAFVVNVGDLFHILSNGAYPSVLHRVRVNKTRRRLSVAYLYGPPDNVQISPFPKLVAPNQPPLYRAVTWKEYLTTKAQRFNEALSAVRL